MDLKRGIFLVLLAFGVPALALPPMQLRTDLLAISADGDRVQQYLSLVEKNTDPVSMAYAGYLHAVWANYAFSPFVKWRNFHKGRCLLDAAVRRLPASAEIRSLRLIVQDRAPRWLNYYHERESDLQCILEALERTTAAPPLAGELAARLLTLTTTSPAQRARIAAALKRYEHGTAIDTG